MEESEPAEDLISVVQVAAKGFRLSLDAGLVPVVASRPAAEAPASETAYAVARSGDGDVMALEVEDKPVHLSDREFDVLRLVGCGESNKSIALRLGMTEATVKVHLRAIYRKVDVQNRTQAALWLRENSAARESR